MGVTTDRVVEALTNERSGKRERNGEIRYLCFEHDDHDPSARFNDAKRFWYCDACKKGGKEPELAERLGLVENTPHRRIVVKYPYTDEAGQLLFQVLRYDPKDFKQRRPDGKGRWIYNLNGTRRVLYRLRELLAADPDEPVLLVEGEKDVDKLRALGFVATCNPHGAKKWRPEYSAALTGRECVVIPDNDADGASHASMVGAALVGVARSVRLLQLDGLPPKGDVSTWLGQGHTADELRELLAAAPPWTLPAPGDDNVSDHSDPQPTTPDFMSDLGNARRLVRLHGADLRYCYAWRSWLVWSGTHWAKDADAEVMRRAKDTVERMYHEAVEKHDEERRQLLQHAMRSQTAAKLRDMVTVAESEPGIPIDPVALDADPWKLNVRNGTIDLRTGKLHPHRREDYCTKVAPVVYDWNARSDVWDRFLADTSGRDADLAAFLQRAVGYSLTGDVSEEVFFFVHGPQAAGKSTFVEAIKATLGDYAATADFETFLTRPQVGGVRNDVARLEGSRFVSSIEVDDGKNLAEGLVKTLTGGDTVSARLLYKEAREFRPRFKLWLAANHAPKVKDSDEAMWRRILRVPFDRTVPKEKRDPAIKRTLTDPAIGGPALLAWAVRGCLAWQRERLGVPAVIERATENYRREMDVLADFYADRCVFDEAAWAKGADLWEVYGAWARANGEKPIAQKEFYLRLAARGCTSGTKKEAGKQFRIWRGVGLLDEEGVTGDGRVTPLPVTFPMTPSHREVIETDAARCHPSPSTNGSEPSLHRVDEEPPSRAKVIQLAVEAFGAAVRPAKKGTG